MGFARWFGLSLALMIAAGCSNTEDPALEQRLAELERRVLELERSDSNEASRGESGPSAARSLQEVQQDAAGRIESLESVETISLVELASAAFEDSPFFGFPLDEEFGGISIEGAEESVEVLLLGQGLEDVGLLEVLLDALGVSPSTADRILRVDSDGSHTIDASGVSVEWSRSESELRVSVDRLA